MCASLPSPAQVLCLSLALLCLTSSLGPVLAQDSQDSILPNLFTRRECGRKGLCPYVKRLIPHLYGSFYGVDPHRRSHEPPSLCGNLCHGDHACPGHQKCCPTNCGYACFDPVFITEH